MSRATFAGPALLSYGFRPFFLAAGLFAATALPVWMAIWTGRASLGGPFTPLDWHIHEMLFGYVGAVLAGFLFTAIPNWTGRMPKQGRPLAALLTLWVAGRAAVAGLGDLPPLAVMAIDGAFPLAVAAMIVIEIVAGRNWRNLKVAVPVTLFAAANLVFHAEAMTAGESDLGRRLGFSVVVLLIALIGGRIIPSFTRNWLARRAPGPMPVPFNRFDAICVAVSGIALAVWCAAPGSPALPALMVPAALLNVLRLARWQGWRCLPSPLLVMLHVAYAFVPAGMLALAAGAEVAGFHLLGIGAIGGMTLAVMMRAAMGHTGRDLRAGRLLAGAFAAVAMAALLRSLAPYGDLLGMSGLTLAAVLWTLGFAAFALKVGPWLAAPPVAKRQPN